VSIIERYNHAPGSEPRVCQHGDPADRANRHIAEMILHDGTSHERFLCKAHAALELAQNHSLLAKALIELYLA